MTRGAYMQSDSYLTPFLRFKMAFRMLALSITVFCVFSLIGSVVADNHLCGLGQCVNNTVCCPGEKECCSDLDLCCGEYCCRHGYECCHGSPRCCEKASSCCGDSLCCPHNTKCCGNKKHCCPAGYTCCDSSNGCCPERSHCCGKYCCAENMKCCPNGTGCYSDGFHCCGNGLACRDGVQCCGEECCSEGYKCCGSHCCKQDMDCCGDTCCASDSATRQTPHVTSAKMTPQVMTSQTPSDTFTETHENLRIRTQATATKNRNELEYLLPVGAIGGVLVLLALAFLALFYAPSVNLKSSTAGVRSKVAAYVSKMRTLVGFDGIKESSVTDVT